MFKSSCPSSYVFLIKWADVTKGILDNQLPLWGNFETLKLNFLKAELDYNSFKFSRKKMDCLVWFVFGASKHYPEPTVTFFLQNKILRLTEANTWLRKDEIALLPWLLCLRLHLLAFYAAYSSHIPTLSSPILKLSPNFPFSLNLSLLHFLWTYQNLSL